MTPAKEVAIAALALLLLSVTFGIFHVNSAYAMGPAPSACTNLYDSSITSAQIFTANGTIINLFAHNGTTITVTAGGWYELDLGFSVSAQSVAGNTGDGQIWIGTNYGGFTNNFCYPEYLTSGMAGSTTMALSQIITEPTANFLPQGTQSVFWYTACDGTLIQSCANSPRVTYTVDWVPAQVSTTTVTATSIESTTVTTTVTSSVTETVTSAYTGTSVETSSTVSTAQAPEFPSSVLALVTAVALGATACLMMNRINKNSVHRPN